MKFLLDTQALLWFLLDDHRLSGQAREKISGPDTLVFISPASLWEIAIFAKLGDTPMPKELIGKLKDGRIKLYFFGIITYKDIFGEKHKTNFCLHLSENLSAFDVCSTYNEVD